MFEWLRDPRRGRLDLLLGLAAMTLLVYGQTLWHDFINFDTFSYIFESAIVNSGLSWANVQAAFTDFHMSNWHPLTMVSHMLDVELFGLEPAGHHATNVLLHLLNVWLLFGLLWRMTGLLWPAFVIAALFAVHPAHVESVAWVAERKDVLSGLFFMLALHSYVEYLSSGNRKYYLLLIVLAALGLMSKPMIITLPFVLLLLDYWPLNRLTAQPGNWRQTTRLWLGLCVEKIPLFVLSVLSGLITMMAQSDGGAMSAGQDVSLFDRLGNAVISYGFYLQKLALPSDFALFYPHPGSQPLVEIAANLSLLVVISLGALFWVRRYPWLLVGWCIFLGMLVPVIGIVQVGAQAAADRYTYLPSIGFFIMLGFGGRELFMRLNLSMRFAQYASTALIGAMVVLGCIQASYWQNSLVVWRHSLLVTDAAYLQVIGAEPRLQGQPRLIGLYLPYYLLGRAYDHEGELQMALLHYQESVRLVPNQPEAFYRLGLVAVQLGLTQQALAAFDQVSARDPTNIERLDSLRQLRKILEATPDE